MATVLAFFGMLLLSIVVALLAAMQLGDYLGAGDEFVLVMLAIVVFAAGSMAVFAIATAATRSARTFTVAAVALAILVLALVAPASLVEIIATRSTNHYNIGVQDIQIALELMVPALLTVLIQWGLTRWRWLRSRGLEDLTHWPWVTTTVAGLVVLNPLGLDILAAAIQQSAADWLRDLWLMIAGAGALVLIAMGAIECYIRARMLRRRTAPSPPATGEMGVRV